MPVLPVAFICGVYFIYFFFLLLSFFFSLAYLLARTSITVRSFPLSPRAVLPGRSTGTTVARSDAV